MGSGLGGGLGLLGGGGEVATEGMACRCRRRGGGGQDVVLGEAGRVCSRTTTIARLLYEFWGGSKGGGGRRGMGGLKGQGCSSVNPKLTPSIVRTLLHILPSTVLCHSSAVSAQVPLLQHTTVQIKKGGGNLRVLFGI